MPIDRHSSFPVSLSRTSPAEKDQLLLGVNVHGLAVLASNAGVRDTSEGVFFSLTIKIAVLHTQQ